MAQRSGLPADRRGIVALEAVIIMPLLILMLVAIFEFCQVLLTQERMAIAANSIGKMVTSMSVRPDGSNTTTGDNIELASSAIYSYFPNWKTIDRSLYSVSITSTKSSQSDPSCRLNCSYRLSTDWSASLTRASARRRPCTDMAPSPPQPESSSTIPAGMFGPASIIAVDIHYSYQPQILSFFLPAFDIQRSAFVSVRVGNQGDSIIYQPSGDIPPAGSPNAPGYAMCS